MSLAILPLTGDASDPLEQLAAATERAVLVFSDEETRVRPGGVLIREPIG